MRVICALLSLYLAESALASPPESSKGITADGRVVVSQYKTSPPWAADIVEHPKPQLPPAERAKKQGGEGFFRVILDVRTGKVRDVVVQRSSGYAAIDANVVRALRQWRLRPGKWREFEIHVALYTHPR